MNVTVPMSAPPRPSQEQLKQHCDKCRGTVLLRGVVWCGFCKQWWNYS